MENLNLYLIIFIIKLVSSTLSNFRLILMANGNKKSAGTVSIFASVAWLASAALVLEDVSSDPFLALPYVAAIVVGNYLGAYLDSSYKLGKSFVTVITDKTNNDLLGKIKNQGFEVTSFDAEGQKDNKKVLMISTERREKSKLFFIIQGDKDKSLIIGENAEEVGD